MDNRAALERENERLGDQGDPSESLREENSDS